MWSDHLSDSTKLVTDENGTSFCSPLCKHLRGDVCPLLPTGLLDRVRDLPLPLVFHDDYRTLGHGHGALTSILTGYGRQTYFPWRGCYPQEEDTEFLHADSASLSHALCLDDEIDHDKIKRRYWSRAAMPQVKLKRSPRHSRKVVSSVTKATGERMSRKSAYTKVSPLTLTLAVSKSPPMCFFSSRRWSTVYVEVPNHRRCSPAKTEKSRFCIRIVLGM